MQLAQADIETVWFEPPDQECVNQPFYSLFGY
jgi:hypothetical protein